MKLSLVLFRHGEAEPERGSGDHARKLSQRGLGQAAKSGAALAALISGPVFFVVSNATRTLQTFDQSKLHFNNFKHAEFESLYLAGLDKIEAAVASVSPGAPTIVVVAHNPGLSAALATLAEEFSGLDTADAAILRIEADSWTEAFAMSGDWNLDSIIRG